MCELVWNSVRNAKIIGISGHIRPDGDCIGAAMSMYLYIKKMYSDKKVYVYFESIPDRFRYIKDIDEALTDYEDKHADLFISVDCSDPERLGGARNLFDKADVTINIDHHISNLSFADINHFVADSSSTCEVLYELYDKDAVDYNMAVCLYTGISHDTGVFKYSNTSGRTMQIAGELMEKGIDFTAILEKTFFEKTYVQNLVLGRCLLESKRLLDGRVIITTATQEMMDEYGADKDDLDGIVNAILQTKGAEAAVFVYQLGDDEFKVSLRASGSADMSRIALLYGGGGHVKAAGCTIQGDVKAGLDSLLRELASELEKG
ncbi:MAG: bifunctional oligoribonuclease/PAP phosphatase NrnA [Lachnospiraceae bacterium]|nr:bifunctional oligoribonuclease/PAP phosphatase NrnA [Lachnospiraceae bacterium]